MPTDTDRLNWMFLHKPRFDGDENGNFCLFLYNGKYHIARGDSKRDCIDAAIAGDHKEVY